MSEPFDLMREKPAFGFSGRRRMRQGAKLAPTCAGGGIWLEWIAARGLLTANGSLQRYNPRRRKVIAFVFRAVQNEANAQFFQPRRQAWNEKKIQRGHSSGKASRCSPTSSR
jgi:hypothetical protein